MSTRRSSWDGGNGLEKHERTIFYHLLWSGCYVSEVLRKFRQYRFYFSNKRVFFNRAIKVSNQLSAANKSNISSEKLGEQTLIVNQFEIFAFRKRGLGCPQSAYEETCRLSLILYFHFHNNGQNSMSSGSKPGFALFLLSFSKRHAFWPQNHFQVRVREDLQYYLQCTMCTL